MKGVVCVAVFDMVARDACMPTALSGDLPVVISLPSVAKRNITGGYWKSVGKLNLLADPNQAPHRQFETQRFVGAVWHSGKMIEDLVNAYYGLGTWEPYPGRRGQLRSLLLP